MASLTSSNPHTYVVKAREPTVLEGKSYLDLPNDWLMIGFKVDTAHIVPGPIDLERFDDALARTLSVYPVHAGRMVRARNEGEPWRVRLSNDGVPVTIIESDAETEVPSNTVIQKPWTLTQGVKFIKYLDYDSTEPLLSATIIRFNKTGSTSIGLSGSHIIGDGFVMWQLARLLSQFYQGLPPLDDPPSYDPVPVMPHDPSLHHQIKAPDLKFTYSLRETAPHLHPGRVVPTRVDFRLTAAQIKQMHATAQAQLRQSDPEAFLSRQDVVAALLAYCISHAEPDIEPIQHFSTIVMSRGIPPRTTKSIGNALLWAVTDPADDFAKETIPSIALRVRKAVQRIRDPEFAAADEEVHKALMLPLANSERAQDFLIRPGSMILNSTWRFDWTSAHFGYPGQTRFFHTVLDGPRFAKMFEPNPTRLSNGDWHTRPGDAEITFHVRDEALGRFKEILESESKKLGLQGDVEWV